MASPRRRIVRPRSRGPSIGWLIALLGAAFAVLYYYLNVPDVGMAPAPAASSPTDRRYDPLQAMRERQQVRTVYQKVHPRPSPRLSDGHPSPPPNEPQPVPVVHPAPGPPGPPGYPPPPGPGSFPRPGPGYYPNPGPPQSSPLPHAGHHPSAPPAGPIPTETSDRDEPLHSDNAIPGLGAPLPSPCPVPGYNGPGNEGGAPKGY